MVERIYSKEVPLGKKVLIKGWVDKVRDLGGLKFFILRDREGSVQVTVKKGHTDEKIGKQIMELNREDCVEVMGIAKKSDKAHRGQEVVPESLKVITKSEAVLPLDIEGPIKSGLDKRFDYRFMDLRNTKVKAIFRVKDVVLTLMREFFESNGFIEVHTPVLQAAGAEGGATMFPVGYYKEKAYLRQSPQLYKQILMASELDKVYEIGPAFRAEKFHTRRHVSEFLSVDMEMAWIESQEDVLKVLENMIVYVFKGCLKKCEHELELLGAKITVPRIPFKRITYDEAVKMVNKAGMKIKWGDDFMDQEEKVLGEIMTKKGNEWYFVINFPSKIKPFYIMYNGKLSYSYDMIYRGMEMASGGQREHRYDVLVEVLKKKGLKPEDFKFYIEPFRYGIPPHGGSGFGVERLVQQMLGLESIKESIMFPRTPDRLVP